MKQTVGYISFGLLLILIVVMGWATWEEHLRGTEYAWRSVYRTPWFNLLWTWLVLTGGYYILKMQLYRKPALLALHLSLILLLIGAMVTRFNGKTGTLHLRRDKTTHIFFCNEDRRQVALPFFLTLNDFRIEYYPGTSSPSNYISFVEVRDPEDDRTFEQAISMNHILKYEGYRFYQSSFDEDMQGSILSVNQDVTGIALTYTGYGLLFFSMLWVLFDQKGRFMELLRKNKNEND